ncbi:uncharacterized protein LOC123538799 isoform X2 [Mercenaria mercenaria]|uniref:uncharacterized protein LOC123538799 isoform X2 n=1 Tax=Mercenaria mercenaria TaxID=6596 RepID=UPI001E1D35A1|nr:uncharacterized protein LOC123538799 isoform X2 [Mercenaria mercenaria]
MTSQRLEQELECPVCFDRFNIPKVLPCQHTFCANCLEGLNDRGSVKCPECRVIHTVPPNGFPINITMQRFLSSSEVPNIPTINVPTHETGPHLPLQPTAPPLQPAPSRLPPVQPIPELPELPSQYYYANQPYQPYQPQHPQSQNSQINHPSSQNAPLRGGQTQNLPTYVSPSQPLPSIQTYGGRSVQPSTADCQAARTTETGNTSEGGSDFDQCKTTFLKYFKLTRTGVRTVISSFLHKYQNFMAVTTSIFLIITFSRFVAGTVWTIGFRDEMIDECPIYVQEWNKHFINFAMFLTAVDWIGIVAFGFYCCYVQFDKSNDDDTT